MSPRQHFSAVGRHIADLLFAVGLTGLLLWVVSMPVAAAAPDRAAAFSCADVSEIPEAECNALVALYHSLGEVFPWLGDNEPCAWDRVICRDGRVVELDLLGHLKGSIPPEIGDLQALEIFALQNNYYFPCPYYAECPHPLVGEIPASIGNLTALRKLELRGGFTGTIPAEIGNLASLEKLVLNGDFSGGSIPASIGNLTALKEAEIGGFFGGPLPKEIGNLANLEVLVIQGGGPLGALPGTLPGPLPAELGNLTKLRVLTILGKINGPLPSSLGNLTNLTGLNLPGNRITGSIPKELGNLAKLVTLDLSGNRLEGPIPAELGNLSALESLLLYSNQLTDVPSALGELPNLWRILLGLNAITEVPANLFDSSYVDPMHLNVAIVDLSYNKLTSIPAGIGDTSTIGIINLDHNLLTGPFPDEFRNLTELEILNLGYNNLYGPLPDWLPELTKLMTFSFEPTNLCIPSDPAFTTWLDGLSYTDANESVSCDTPVQPSAEFWNSNLKGNLFPAEFDFGELSTPGAEAFDWDFDDGATSDERQPSHTFTQPGIFTVTLTVTYPSTVVSSSVPIEVVSRTTLCQYRTQYMPLEECVALLEFYEATDGANWTMNGGWTTAEGGPTSNPCVWYGVTCADSVTVAGGEQDAAVRRVTGLRLANNGLNGPLPASIGNLTALTVLDLSGNKLHVELPTSLQKLTSLDKLSIDATEVCLPPDGGLEAWLDGIPDGPEIASCTYLQLPVLIR